MIKINAHPLNKNIWFTSDWHFNHDRKFIYQPRGFESIEDMNEAILQRHNSMVKKNDDVYVLGDLMLGENSDIGLSYIEKMNGDLHICLGNHDTDRRACLYKALDNVVEIKYVCIVKHKGYRFYCSHYPTLTANLEAESLKKCTCNLFGHTHQKDHFYNDIPFMYNVGVDAHHCCPVLLDDIIEDMKKKCRECIAFL